MSAAKPTNRRAMGFALLNLSRALLNPSAGFRFVCYCKDCQAFARFLDRADVLDPDYLRAAVLEPAHSFDLGGKRLQQPSRSRSDQGHMPIAAIGATNPAHLRHGTALTLVSEMPPARAANSPQQLGSAGSCGPPGGKSHSFLRMRYWAKACLRVF